MGDLARGSQSNPVQTGARPRRNTRRGPEAGEASEFGAKYELVNGTLVAQPKYAWWFAGVGWAVENHGVDPDVEVTIAPHDWAAGRDPQLDTAVRLALEALEGARPPLRPPSDQATSRSLPASVRNARMASPAGMAR
jgi:hypothetical protein